MDYSPPYDNDTTVPTVKNIVINNITGYNVAQKNRTFKIFWNSSNYKLAMFLCASEKSGQRQSCRP